MIDSGRTASGADAWDTVTPGTAGVFPPGVKCGVGELGISGNRGVPGSLNPCAASGDWQPAAIARAAKSVSAAHAPPWTVRG